MTDQTTARDRATAPTFGDLFENAVASPDNPRRVGQFVRVVRRPRGRMNAGTWWQMTDGRGDFWESNPANLRPLPGAPAPNAVDRLVAAAEGLEAVNWHGLAYDLRDIAAQLTPGDAKSDPALNQAAAVVARALAGAQTADVAEGVEAADEPDANRCTACGKPLRRCCYMCPAGAHDDYCEGVEDDDGMDVEAQGETADEVKQLRDRDRLLRHYLGHVAKALGRPVSWEVLSKVGDIEVIGEGVLAELERRAVAPADQLTTAQEKQGNI